MPSARKKRKRAALAGLDLNSGSCVCAQAQRDANDGYRNKIYKDTRTARHGETHGIGREMSTEPARERLRRSLAVP